MVKHTSCDYLEAAATLNNTGVALLKKESYEAATERLNEALFLMNCAVKSHSNQVDVSSAAADAGDDKEKFSPNSKAACIAEDRSIITKATRLADATNEHVKNHSTSTQQCQSSATSLTMPPPPQEQSHHHHHQAQQQRQQPILILQVPNTDNGSLNSLREIQLLASVIILNLSIANHAAAEADHQDIKTEKNNYGTKHLETALRLAKMSWSIVSQLVSVMKYAHALEKPTLLILAQTTLRQLIAVHEQQATVTETARGSSSSSSSSSKADAIKYYHLLHGIIHMLSMIQATRALFDSAHAGAA